MRSLFAFPNPVNEVAARSVAAGVVAMTGLILVGTAAGIEGARWLVIPLALGFWARVLTGPTLSPLGQLATRVVAPHFPNAERLVPGPPKRFAQGIGATLSTAAALAWLAFGSTAAGVTLVAAIAVAAALEATLALCLGCRIYGYLAIHGILDQADCLECADISLRQTPHKPAALRP